MTTHITFEDGSSHTEETHKDNLKSTILRLTRGPAVQMGIIKEVKIVDKYDCIIFLSQYKNGTMEIVFPKQ